MRKPGPKALGNFGWVPFKLHTARPGSSSHPALQTPESAKALDSCVPARTKDGQEKSTFVPESQNSVHKSHLHLLLLPQGDSRKESALKKKKKECLDFVLKWSQFKAVSSRGEREGGRRMHPRRLLCHSGHAEEPADNVQPGSEAGSVAGWEPWRPA